MINNKLKKIIESQDLSNQDSLIRFISLLSTMKQLEIYNQAVESPEILSFLAKNLEEKEMAFTSGKKEDWDKVLNSEENFLRELPE